MGVVTSANTNSCTVAIDKNKYELLRSADKILLRATFNTSETSTGGKPAVVFQSDSKLDVKLGVKVHTNIGF